MDLRQKLEFQEVIDNYLVDHEIYELFQGYIGDLMIDKPDDPIMYLINKLGKPDHRRLIITGGSGRIRKDVSKELSTKLHINIVSASELLKEEVERNGKLSAKIQTCWKEGVYVKDNIFLDIVLPVLEKCESDRISYILEGFPRTRAQAIALQRAGILPDRVVILNLSQGTYKNDYIERYSQYGHADADYDGMAEMALQEYELGLQGVINEYSFQCHHVNAEDDQAIVAESVFKVFLVKGRSAVPRKPPRILIIGGPLSGKSTQTQKVAEKYGLTLVKVKDVIDQAIAENSDIGRIVASYVNTKQVIPDKILIELMRERLEKIDCKLNGWVLDGFPLTNEQARSLRYLKKNPTNVFFLEANDNLIFERAHHRRIDPRTGKISGKDDIEISGAIPLLEDSEENVKSRLASWREETIKIHAEYSKIGKSIKAEISAKMILDSISDSLETSISAEIS